METSKTPLTKEEHAELLSSVLSDLHTKAVVDIEASKFKISSVTLWRIFSGVGIAFLVLLQMYATLRYPSRDDVRLEYVSKQAYLEGSQVLIAGQERIAETQEAFGKNLQSINETLAAFREKLTNDARQDRELADVEARTERQVDEVKRRVERLEGSRK